MNANAPILDQLSALLEALLDHTTDSDQLGSCFLYNVYQSDQRCACSKEIINDQHLVLWPEIALVNADLIRFLPRKGMNGRRIDSVCQGDGFFLFRIDKRHIQSDPCRHGELNAASFDREH